MAPNIRPYHVLAASIPTIAAFFFTILYFRKKKILRGSIKFTDSSITSTATATISSAVKETEEDYPAPSTAPFIDLDSQEKYSSEVADAIIKAVRDLETAAPITEIINELEDETTVLPTDLLSPAITDHKLSSSNNNNNNSNNSSWKNLSTTTLFYCESDATEMNEKLEFTVQALDTSTQLITEDSSQNDDDFNLSSIDYRRSDDVEEVVVARKHYEVVANKNILPAVINDSSPVGDEIVDSLTAAVNNCGSTSDYAQDENCQKVMVDDKCQVLADNCSDNLIATNGERPLANNLSDNPNQYGNSIDSGGKVNKLENADVKVKSQNVKKSTAENRKGEEEARKNDVKNNTDKGSTNRNEISSSAGERKSDKVPTNKNELSANAKKTDAKSNSDKTSATKLSANKTEVSALSERRNDAKFSNTDKTPTKKNDVKKNNTTSSSNNSSNNGSNNGSNSSGGSKIKSKVNESHTTKTDHIEVEINENQKTDMAEAPCHDKVANRKSDNRIADDSAKRPESGNKKRNHIKEYTGKSYNVEEVGYSNNDSGRTAAPAAAAATNRSNSHQNPPRQCNSDFYSSTAAVAGNRKTTIFSKKYSSQKPRSSNDSNKKFAALATADINEEPKAESNSSSQQTLINDNEEKSQTEDQTMSKAAASNKQLKTNAKKKTNNSDEEKEELSVNGPVDGMLEEGQNGVNSQHLFDARSEGSSDSGKGRSEGATTPTVHSPPGGSSVSGDNSIMTVYQFVISQKYVGKLIGRRGQFINHIKESANTYVYIKKHPFSATKKVCAIEGTQQDINTALELIRARFPENQYEDLTLEEFPMIPIAEPATLQSDYCQALELVEGVNNDVIISSLISAGHMFLQQPMHPTYQQLITLNFLMNETYSRTQTPAVINPSVDTIVAAPAVDGWYRAQIVSVNDEEEICDIRFLDYGGYLSLSFSALRAIRYDFLNLPFQAVECYLANIAPIDGVWSDEAKLMVETLTYGQVLRAQVYDYAENGAPLILLYSLIGSQVIMINQELVARGYAYDIVNIPSADAVSATATQNEPAATIKQTTPPQTSASVAAV